MSWTVQFTERADKDLKRLGKTEQTRIRQAIDLLPQGQGEIRPLKGKLAGLFRLRVGEWRVVFIHNLGARTVFVVRILPRGSAYQP